MSAGVCKLSHTGVLSPPCSFVKGNDVNNWVSLDPKTGQLSVAKKMDRESSQLQNSTYQLLVYVVDNGTRTINTFFISISIDYLFSVSYLVI